MDRVAAGTRRLGVMAKYWEPGSVKTRLGVSIGMTRAAEIHRAFCVHLANSLADMADERSFVITPADRNAVFAAHLPDGWQIEIQSDGDLGRRMQMWFQGRRNPEVDQILIGADCPLLDAHVIDETEHLLSDHDVVLGPALDGGYYLIALRGGWRPDYAGLFDEMPWSSDKVFEMTCRRAKQLGLRLACLPPMQDVDTVTELDQLRSRLGEEADDGRLATLEEQIRQVLNRGSEL